jgi:multicomponent Na+:H+ antiporter subunit D
VPPIIVLPVLIPLIGSLAALVAPRRLAGWVYGLTALPTLLAAGWLAAAVADAGPLRHALGGWPAPLGIVLVTDGAAAAMILLSGVVFTVASLYARVWPGAFEAAGRRGRPLFWPVWLLLWAGVNAVFVAGDVFNMYICLELTTLAAVTLVAQTATPAVLSAAMRYLLFALLGSLFFLAGVALIYAERGVLDLALLSAAASPSLAGTVAVALMTAGLLIKTAAFPFHFWLPPAHGNAIAPVSAVLSALVVKTSFFLMVRLWVGPFPELAEGWAAPLMGALGAGAIVWGGVQALLQQRLKLLIAYSTVAQIGYLMLLFPLITGAPQEAWNGAFFQVMAHGLAKAAAFLAAGNILLAIGNDRLDAIAGLSDQLRMSLLAFALAGISLIGLPPFGGFVAKWLLLDAAISSGRWVWAGFIIGGGLVTAAYVTRVLTVAMATPHDPDAIRVKPIPRGLEIAALAMALSALALGLAASPVQELLSVGVPFELTAPIERIASTQGWLPLAILLSSSVCGIAIFFLGERQTALRTTLNLAGASLKAGLVLFLLWRVYLGETFEARLAFLPGLDLYLRADPLTLQFLTLSAGLWLITTIYAIGYLEDSPNRSRFFGFFSLSVTASTGIAMSGNLLTLLFFYELLTITTYPLVVHRGVPKSLAAGRTYLAYTVAGGVAVLLGAVMLHALGGNLEFSPFNSLATLFDTHPGAVLTIFALLILGFGTKAAIVPLHSWLPIAMVAPAPVSALLHAVAVVKAGVFGIIRVIYDIFGASFAHTIGLMDLLAIMAAATIVYGSVQALRQDEIKRRLAYSTISQLSYITLGAAMAGPIALIGALVHLVHQGLMKITLFFCAGNLAEVYNISRVSDVAGMGRVMPVTMTAFTVAALGMIGLPPMAGFISKWYLAGGAGAADLQWVWVVLAASSLLNAAYFLPIVYAAWFRAPAQPVDRLRDAGWWLLAPPIATALLTLLVGLTAGAPFSPLGWAEVISERVYYGVSPEP